MFFCISDGHNLYLIYGIAVINSLGLALFGTSSRSILGEIIEQRELLIQGNSSLEICMQIGAIIAAGVTGVLYDKLGIHIIIYIMVFSLAISAFIMKKMEGKALNSNTSVEVQEYIVNKKIIFLLGIITFIPYIVTLLSNNVLPGYVSMHLNAPSSVYGTSDMLYGIGALVGGFLISIITRIFHKNIEIKLFALSFITLLGLFFNKKVWILFIAYFVFGLSNTALKVFMNTFFMKVVPQEIYGKCFSLMNSFSSIIQITVLAILGHVLDVFGNACGYAILAIVMLVDGIILICYKSYYKNSNIM